VSGIRLPPSVLAFSQSNAKRRPYSFEPMGFRIDDTAVKIRNRLLDRRNGSELADLPSDNDLLQTTRSRRAFSDRSWIFEG
jgi:hypothetical protein